MITSSVMANMYESLSLPGNRVSSLKVDGEAEINSGGRQFQIGTTLTEKEEKWDKVCIGG